MKIGIAYTLLEIFGSVFTVYPTSASITTTVSSVESKTKKYTYVEDLYYPDTFYQTSPILIKKFTDMELVEDLKYGLNRYATLVLMTILQ